MIFKFSKSSRLLSRSEFLRLRRHSTTRGGRYIFVDICKGRFPQPRLGITVTKKYGKSHERNHFKRLVREAFRQIQLALPSHVELNIRPKTLAKEVSSAILLKEILDLTKDAHGSFSQNLRSPSQ